MRYLTLWMILAMVSCVNADQKLYVSADASANGNGSRHQPYQTLTQARDGIRTLRKRGTLKHGEAITVYVEQGVYPLHASFELTAEDSGTTEAPVVYRTREGSKAKFHGGVAIAPATMTPVTDSAVLSRLDAAVRDKVRMCDLSDKVSGEFPEFRTAFRGAPAAPWLYVNQKPMAPAVAQCDRSQCWMGRVLEGRRYRTAPT